MGVVGSRLLGDKRGRARRKREKGDGGVFEKRLLISRGSLCSECTEMAQSEKRARNRTAEHSAWMEIRGGGSGVAHVFMCAWRERQDGGSAACDKSSFPSIIWKHSLFPDCWLCLFSATQTLLGNGFSCQKSVINTATGCELHNRVDGCIFKGADCVQFISPWYGACVIPQWKGPV